MKALREFMQKNPMMGWALAALLTLGAAAVVITRVGAKSETQQLTQMITIRCTETGDTWQVLRGVMEKELYLRPYPIDPNQGLINPKTGKPTGFPIDAWKETVERVNIERSEVEQPPTAKPPAPVTPSNK